MVMKRGTPSERFIAVLMVTPPGGRWHEEKEGPFDTEDEADKAIRARQREGRTRGEQVHGYCEPA